jgi:DNA-binding beta-propeller fold protein YncE
MKPLIAIIAAVFTVGGAAIAAEPESFPKTLPFPHVRTLAGDGQPGATDGAPARVNRPHGLAYGKGGSLYFADRGNHQVRVLRPDGTVATLAGTGKAGFADGPAHAAQFSEPIAVAVERTGAIYVADRNNHRIRKITPDGKVVTLAGAGEAGFADGNASAARFNQPYGVALDTLETTLYVADYLNHAIRRIDLVLERVDTLSGNGTAGFADGKGNAARFNQPYNVRVDGEGRLWVPDQLNHAVRRVTPAGEVTTVAGSGKAGYADGAAAAAQFNNPTGVAPLPNGAAVVADRNNNRLRLVTPDGSVTALAGTGEAGFADGPVAESRFNQPLDVDFDDSLSRILVSEDKGHRLRVLPKDAGR